MSPLQVALPLQENNYNFVNREMQMMTSNEVSTSPCSDVMDASAPKLAVLCQA
ncbi:hypothetical protein ABHN84_20190 [Shewanella vesiculosa]|uniref:Uncharacterized protein n=1 Tax=Shewanella vesiculosa TaxID=518738 RepID=A0ABV0FX68_9GAMM